jgi:release factor glutamine methyltransferase
MLTIMEAVQKAAAYFARRGIPSARLDAEVLLAHVLKLERIDLYIQHDRPLLRGEIDAYRKLLQERTRGVPVPYLTGRREFFSREFFVNPSVLIPRPETELLVEAAADWCKGREGPLIVDVGTGSGIIAITLALLLPGSKVVGVDISEEALAVARRNADYHQVEVEFRRGDLLSPLQDLRGRIDAIVSNPPYIAAGEWEELPREVRQEPAAALLGGADGLDFYRRLLLEGAAMVVSGGLLAVEVGWGQAERVAAMAGDLWRVKEIIPDYAGIPRVIMLTRRAG